MRTAVAPPDDLDRHRAAHVLGREDGGVAREVVVGLGARLQLDHHEAVGLHEADGDDAGEASQSQLERVEAHHAHDGVGAPAS